MSKQPEDMQEDQAMDAADQDQSPEAMEDVQEQMADEPFVIEEDPLAELQSQYDQLNDKYLRLAADYQNYQRRAQQNVVQAREQQTMSLARQILPVLDHFDQAFEHAGPSDDEQEAAPSDLFKGMTIVRDELIRVLGTMGIQRLDAQPGEEFDPNRHEALMRQPSEEYDSGNVAQQLQPGYSLGDKILRPAKVIVVQ